MTAKMNISLAELVEKGADAGLLREVIQYVTQRMITGRACARRPTGRETPSG